PELQPISRGFETYVDYTSGRLSPTPPETKTVPGQTTQYYQIPLIYNFGTNTSKALSDFLLEGCEMTTDGGIGVKEGDKKTDYSIMVRFNLCDPKEAKFVETLDDIYFACIHILNYFRKDVKMLDFDPNAP